MSNSPLVTVNQFSAKHEAFSVPSLRWIIFRSADKTDPDYSKFRPAIHKIGRRVLIEEQRFLAIALGNDEMEVA